MNRISEQSPSAERERAPGRHGRRRISEERAASGPWRETHLAPQGASTAGRGGVSTRPSVIRDWQEVTFKKSQWEPERLPEMEK